MCSFCTRLICSTPPATATGTPSTMTWWAADAIAWSPEQQKRLIVVAATETGRPARSADRRAMLWPVAPCGQAAADDDVLDLAALDAGALDGVPDEHGRSGSRHGCC